MIFSINKLYTIFISFLFLWILFAYDPNLALSEMNHQKLEEQLENYMMEHEETTAGVATIVINRDEIIHKTQGYADRDNKVLINDETVFEWGSVSKILVWISILQLVEDGKLNLDTDIKSYLPQNFQMKTSFDKRVTLQHLMNHSAGFDDSYTDLMISKRSISPPLKEVLENANIKQVFLPGEVVAYSNYGASLAAYIVEEVSGLDYRNYVKKFIFEPLNMTKTAIDPHQNDNDFVQKQREKVQGYTENLQLIEPNYFVIPMYPSGSVTGVADDLEKLLQALLSENGKPLFKKHGTIDILFKPSLHYPSSDIPRIANGLFFLPSKSEHVFGHGGNTVAFSSSFYLDRQEGIGVLVLTNQANESTFTLGIPEIIFGEYTHKQTDLNLEDASKWNGVYEPARSPFHGFSKIYRLFLRSKAEQTSSHDLMMNDFYYSQAEPGVYVTQDGFSAYGIDVYSEHSQKGKILSSANTDLLYVPFYKHILEWTGIILAGFSILFSAAYVIFTFYKKLRGKNLSILLISQHILNVLMFLNVLWISYKTLSMTTYASLKIYLTANVVYMIVSIVLSSWLLFRVKKVGRQGMLIRILTILATIILFVNIIYWEFYY